MTFTGLIVALILTTLLMMMATLGTSVLYAFAQVLSWCADQLFDLNGSTRMRA